MDVSKGNFLVSEANIFVSEASKLSAGARISSIWYFADSFLNFEICHSWRSKSSRHHSVIKKVTQESLKDALETHEESPFPVHIEILNFALSFLYVNICNSWWHSKSSTLHSRIKNVIQDSLKDNLESQEESPLPVDQECWIFGHSFLKSKVIHK